MREARPEVLGEASGGAVPPDAVGEQAQDTETGKIPSVKNGHDECTEGGGTLQRQESGQGGDRKRKRRSPFQQPQPVADSARNKLRAAMAEALLGAVEDDFEGAFVSFRMPSCIFKVAGVLEPECVWWALQS